ncbi:MAG: peroxiredoxin [Geminocystis sp.]|nr:peroxiredoxin [Geminocystis sp.]MCS7148602.1 peroxiredoxin [Geminocystis sp.]MCX8078135.1 peroxiredoxin [Geminocystis sp.]MDW8115006.1 peroxiredoxin [Geminocystis sp.]MDW8464274.1 peroxiredoxin [Geminocystis sp.]
MTSLKVGDKAPDFALPSADGKIVRLSDFLGKKAVVLFFYPKDDTPGCTMESCTFRDNYQVFQEAGAEVIGISGDSPQSHRQFASKYQLPFPLLSDENNLVRKLYGVPNALFFLPGRVTYVIDKNGIIRHIFNSLFDVKAHVQEALKTIQSL